MRKNLNRDRRPVKPQEESLKPRLDRRAILDHITWRHSHSCVFDDLPTDGYDHNEVEQLRVHLIRLCEMKEEVLVRSGLRCIWSNKECDAKIVEELHRLSASFLEHVSSHTTAPAAALPTLDEVAAAQPDLRLARKSKGPSQVMVWSASATVFEPRQPSKKRRLKKRASKASFSTPELRQAKGPPPAMVVASVSGPPLIGTSAHASTSRHSLALGGSAAGGFVGKFGAKVMRRQMDPLDSLARSALSHDAEYDGILDDDFGTTNRGKEIELTLFPLTPSPYQMSYPYDGVSSPISLDNKLEKVERDYDALGQENIELRSQRDVASEEMKVTQFIGSGVEGLVRRLLASDEFHATLAHVAYLGINYGVERGLSMGRSNADFEAAARKVSNFHIGAEADFNEALVAFPTTSFPFLGKIVVEAGGALSEVTQILPDKLARSATPALIAEQWRYMQQSYSSESFLTGGRLCGFSLPSANSRVFSFALVFAYSCGSPLLNGSLSLIRI
nr:hypothetical protein [Tanacetum cinerariifolium]